MKSQQEQEKKMKWISKRKWDDRVENGTKDDNKQNQQEHSIFF